MLSLKEWPCYSWSFYSNDRYGGGGNIVGLTFVQGVKKAQKHLTNACCSLGQMTKCENELQ